MRRDCNNHGEREMERDRERQIEKVRDRKRNRERVIEGDIEGERNRNNLRIRNWKREIFRKKVKDNKRY